LIASPAFTVFTPTYNRAHLLPRVYESLKTQTLKNFEWLIIDDGSTDDTKATVIKWMSDAPFRIRYMHQTNAGKHVATNQAVRLAEGFLLATLDSDDWYVPTALERLQHHWSAIDDKQKFSFAGVCGLFAYTDGQIVGTRFPNDVLDTDDISLKARYRVRGDKIGATRLTVMREFPFPEDLGRFVTESLVWNRIGSRYLTRFFNEVIALKEYQSGGLSDRARVVLANSPMAARMFHYELVTSGRSLPLEQLVRSHANLVRHSLHLKLSWKTQARETPSKILFGLTAALGWFLYLRDRRLLRRENGT
jgi:glycosyltransferase involved in cell wall biosynthesis